MPDHQIPPGLASSLIILAEESQCSPADFGWVLKTPSDPAFYFGNLICVNQLVEQQKENWIQIFKDQFSDTPGVQHITLWWQQKTQSVPTDEWLQAGFEYKEFQVRALRLGYLNVLRLPTNDYLIRPFNSELDWQQWLDLSCMEGRQGHSEQAYRQFNQMQANRYLKLAERHAGNHWGVFSLQGQLLAFAGLYFAGNMGRFQYVYTHPEFRRQGLSSVLLQEMTLNGLSRAETLIIIADEHSPATRFYDKLGFMVISREASLCWWPGKQLTNS